MEELPLGDIRSADLRTPVPLTILPQLKIPQVKKDSPPLPPFSFIETHDLIGQLQSPDRKVRTSAADQLIATYDCDVSQGNPSKDKALEQLAYSLRTDRF